MTLESFKQSITTGSLAENVSIYLKALWYDARGDWDAAHKTIQDINDKNAAWIHAYLHRKEGDIFNADYWYNLAGKKRHEISLNDEWEQITKALL